MKLANVQLENSRSWERSTLFLGPRLTLFIGKWLWKSRSTRLGRSANALVGRNRQYLSQTWRYSTDIKSVKALHTHCTHNDR